MVDVILGLQWGDEGKGKIVDYFAKDYQVIARFQGGSNAGHTIYINDEKVVLHQIPSGIFYQEKLNLIGNGVVLDAVSLKNECEKITDLGINLKQNLYISQRAHLILPTHRALDKASELAKGNDKIGSTLKGISPAYMDKTGRNGLRVGDLNDKNFTTAYIKLRLKHQRLLDNFNFTEDIQTWEEEFFEAIDYLRNLNIVNGEYFINDQLNNGKKILAEGAQGSMLDIDFGTFPYVTSSSTISGGVCSGLGIAPQKINEVFGVSKAYCTRVGSGPFPTELNDIDGENLRKIGQEFGATTGRPRRCGWIDLVALRFACMINGVTNIVMTKTDVLDSFNTLQICSAYQINGIETSQIPFQMGKIKPEPIYKSFKGWNTDISKITEKDSLPEELSIYLKFISKFLQTPIKYISNGPERNQLIFIK